MSEVVVDGRYRIVRRLGEGGMGSVYEAVHVGTRRRVALKVISEQALANKQDIVARFQREAHASGSVESPHVVQIYDSGFDAATRSPYLAMELLEGNDLHEIIARIGPLAPDAVLRIGAQACAGLDRAHARGVIHRDIKPANLFLARDGADLRIVKLLDFGIAKVKPDQLSASDNHGLTRSGAMLGSPLYMSPEQARGSKSLDARSDLFSLGVVMYEALCGRPPNAHCETLGELILAICSGFIEPVQDRAPWVSADIAAFVRKALAQDAHARFQTALEMKAAIVELLPAGSQLAITESMLGPISGEQRAVASPRLADERANLTPVSGGNLAAIDGGSGSRKALAISGTTSSAGGSGLISGRTARRGPLAAAAVAALGAGVWVVTHTAAKTTAQVSAPTIVSAAPASAPSVVSEPLTRIARLRIAAQPGAAITVDGLSATVENESIELHGAIGSVHRVSVVAAGRELVTDVVIAERGAVPDIIELPKEKSVQQLPAPIAAQSVRPRASAPAATAPRPAPSASPGGAPPVAREFGR